MFFLVNKHVYVHITVNKEVSCRPPTNPEQSRKSITITLKIVTVYWASTYYMPGIGLRAFCALSHLIA